MSTKIKIKRGTDANRLTFIPDIGELIYTIDTKLVYIGDGITVGGILTNKSYVDTQLTLKEDKSNKATNFTVVNDTLYPSVKAAKDYVDSKIPTDYSKVVYVNAVSPTTATIFDLNNPPVTNDNALKNDVNNIYIGTDASTWVYLTTPAGYTTKIIPSSSNFYLAGTTTDSGSTKTGAIERSGTVGGAPATLSNHFITKSQSDLKQDISTQIEVNTSQNAQTIWHGTTVIFTANCTITIPSSLINTYIFNGITLPGVTITWAITAPHTWLFGTPSPTGEKQIFTLTKRGATNSILLLPPA